jgi:hypothetical protein
MRNSFTSTGRKLFQDNYLIWYSTAMNQEDRDGMVTSGMESGWWQSVEALGKLLEVVSDRKL